MIPTLLAQRSFWLETPASNSAQNHDLVFYPLLYVMAFFFCLVVAVMLAFVVLYRRRKGQLPDDAPTHNTPLEIFWTVVPLGIVLGFFALGLRYLRRPGIAARRDADVIDVEASQWHFNFKYPNGAESDELYLQVNRPVLLKLTSKDVTHALFIPAFRVQRNAVPGRTTQLWFQPTEFTTGKDPLTGEDELLPRLLHAVLRQRPLPRCTPRRSCSKRRTTTTSWPRRPIFSWTAPPNADAAALRRGRQEALRQHGLFPVPLGRRHRRHRGRPGRVFISRTSPSRNRTCPAIRSRRATTTPNGTTTSCESILRPEVKIVQGYQNVMPPQESALSGSPYKEKKLAAMVEYIKSLGDPKYYTPMKTPEPTDAEKPRDSGQAKPSAAAAKEEGK